MSTPLFRVNQSVILGAIEAVYGVDQEPTGAANALQVANLAAVANFKNLPRNLIRGFLGGSEQLPGDVAIECSFDVEIAGSGTAGTAPAWGPLMRACGMAETITPATLVAYTPITDNHESLTIYYYHAGVVHTLLGARGTVACKMKQGEVPIMAFKFTGLDGGVAAAAPAVGTFTAWKKPVAITNANAAQVTLGCNYAAGAFTGGTVYTSQGLEVDLNNTVTHSPLLGSESVEITDRVASGKVVLALSGAEKAAFYEAVKAVTLTSLGFSFGGTAGNKIMVFAPAVQRTNPTDEVVNGNTLSGYSLGINPDVGNDELTLVVL